MTAVLGTAGLATAAVLQAVDGIAHKVVADQWSAAGEGRAELFAAAVAVRSASAVDGHDGDCAGDVIGEVFQIADVTGVYVIAATSGGFDDDDIDDIGGSGAAA